MSSILEDVSVAQKSKLVTGDFQAYGTVLQFLLRTSRLKFSFLEWKLFIARFHQEELKRMIKAICTERRIFRHGSTKYSWRLSIFDDIQWDEVETSGRACPPPICLLYKHEAIGRRWEDVLALSSLHTWAVGGIPFQKPEAKRLLEGLWLNDDVIDAYLVLCGFSWPHIKFLPTQWFSCFETWGKEASSRTTSWVRSSFRAHASGRQLMRNIP